MNARVLLYSAPRRANTKKRISNLCPSRRSGDRTCCCSTYVRPGRMLCNVVATSWGLKTKTPLPRCRLASFKKKHPLVRSSSLISEISCKVELIEASHEDACPFNFSGPPQRIHVKGCTSFKIPHSFNRSANKHLS